MSICGGHLGEGLGEAARFGAKSVAQICSEIYHKGAQKQGVGRSPAPPFLQIVPPSFYSRKIQYQGV